MTVRQNTQGQGAQPSAAERKGSMASVLREAGPAGQGTRERKRAGRCQGQARSARAEERARWREERSAHAARCGQLDRSE